MLIAKLLGTYFVLGIVSVLLIMEIWRAEDCPKFLVAWIKIFFATAIIIVAGFGIAIMWFA